MSIRQCPRCGYQLLPDETQCPRCRDVGVSPRSAPLPRPRTSGLVVAAFVVAVLALFGGCLAIPALILGIASLIKINRSHGQLGGRGMAWSAIGLSLVGFLVFPIAMAVLFPVFARAREAARKATCVADVNGLTLGALAYARDHNDRLPPADTWSDDILPYVKDRRVFVCPNARGASSAYAYNRAVAGLALNEIADPQRTVLIYESNLGWNGAGGPETMAPRHVTARGRACVVGFVDGQVIAISSEQLPNLVWQPGEVPAQ